MHFLTFKLSLASVLLASQIVVGNPSTSTCSKLLFANNSVAAGPTIEIKGKYIWAQIFDYDNTANAGEITHKYEYVESGSYTAQTFNEAVTSEAKKLSQTGSIQLETGASYGPVSASVKEGFESTKEINDFLQTTTREQTEQTVSYSRTETREYKIGPRSRLVLYQRTFESPGIYIKDASFRTTPKPLSENEKVEEVIVTLALAPKNFVKSLKVVYGTKESQAPGDRVRDWFGGSGDMNAGFDGKYVWLVAEYTTKVSEALTRFDLAIQADHDDRYVDLAAGAGGAFRYLIPVRETNKNLFISELTLARAKSSINDLSSVIWPGFPQGNSGDINRGRKGDYLYLVWQLQRAYPI